ncbi:hypothetical protein [Streptomyces sp. NBC_01285]|uniref:hypothetical protein n=1 Tax=Streptomyces sp. NBC_01285 TaxID=2903813 RepID=UPI00225485B6|nr:hypothetical protein [Streptomyces sp. NBC_01285]MCX4774099.1 hypothetical protein [Streptomyces sp. NBC_01285]
MGHKLAGLFGIIAATLAFGIGVTVEAGQSHSPRSTQQVVADDKGPTVIGTRVLADDKGPTVIVATPNDDKGPTVIVATPNDDKGPTAITDTTNDDKGPTSPLV